MKKLASFAVLQMVIALLVSCGSTSGTPCETVGSGFTASHDCRHKCLSRTAIVCPDESRTLPKLCSGQLGCAPGGCEEGEVCYSVNDPFEQVSFCIPESVCGPMNPQEKTAWEVFSQQLAAQSRRQHELRFRRTP